MFQCKYCKSKLLLGIDDYYCKECDMTFQPSEVIQTRKHLVRRPELSNDPYFFQYTTTRDLIECLTVELYRYLSLARRVKRELKEKQFRKRDQFDKLDKQNLSSALKTIHKIETILIERNGYFPHNVMPATVEKEYKKVLKRQEVFLRRES